MVVNMMSLMMRKVIFFITQLSLQLTKPRPSGWLIQNDNLTDGIDGDRGGGTYNYCGDEKGDDLGDDSQWTRETGLTVMTWTSARNKAASTVIIVQRKMPGAKTNVIMMIIKIITNSLIIYIIQPLSQGLFSHCKTFLKLLSFALCAQDFFASLSSVPTRAKQIEICSIWYLNDAS